MEPYAWLAWLGEKDAHVLLLTLMQAIEGTSSIEDLRTMVQDWRKNALRALEADDWQAQVDTYLEVRVDARIELLARPDPEEETRRQPGRWEGKVWISPDFDAPNADIIRDFEGDASDDPDPTPDLLRRLAAHGIAGRGGTDPVTVDVLRLRRMLPADVRHRLDALLHDLCTALDRRRED